MSLKPTQALRPRKQQEMSIAHELSRCGPELVAPRFGTHLIHTIGQNPGLALEIHGSPDKIRPEQS
jgi:hypothetical protein